MESLRIRVFLFDNSSKPLFERIVYPNASISVPYSSLMADFKFLFGDKVIVEFSFL